ncbi:MAG: C1 family peptidase [Aestuariibaculum sp.]
MKNSLLSFVIAFISFTINSQTRHFETLIDIETSAVLSQGNTGTCWSFSTSSFLESEIIRLTGKHIDLSEMFQVRTTYPKKAENYIMRQGKAQFGQGGLAHDVINSVRDYGLVPLSAYSGLANNEDTYNHSELFAVLKSMLNTYVDNPAKKLSPQWKQAVSGILDVYLGEIPKSFTYKGKTYTPKRFLEITTINPDDYISLTSFTNAPFYSSFILNIPDNFSNGSFYNIPIDKLISTIDNALKKGYTVALDTDVSEPTFSAKHGIAFIPENPSDNNKGLTEIIKEKTITQDYRQQEFENFDTTDDHLMHIVGKLKDQNGTIYYKVKNSWGSNGDRVKHGGYIYMSTSFLKLKTISILVHKDAFPTKK